KIRIRVARTCGHANEETLRLLARNDLKPHHGVNEPLIVRHSDVQWRAPHRAGALEELLRLTLHRADLRVANLHQNFAPPLRRAAATRRRSLRFVSGRPLLTVVPTGSVFESRARSSTVRSRVGAGNCSSS